MMELHAQFFGKTYRIQNMGNEHKSDLDFSDTTNAQLAISFTISLTFFELFDIVSMELNENMCHDVRAPTIFMRRHIYLVYQVVSRSNDTISVFLRLHFVVSSILFILWIYLAYSRAPIVNPGCILTNCNFINCCWIHLLAYN